MNQQFVPTLLLHVRHNKLVLSQDALDFLLSVRGLVFPVSVVGSILTGKSTLLNQLISRDIFETGRTTVPKTKGVYFFMEQLKNTKQNEKVWLLYLDVQGFDNSFSDYTQQIDIQLLSFVLVVCKVILYNSFGALDSCLFQRLAILHKTLPENLKFLSQLAFVQRDFTLRLQSQYQPLTSSEYLDFYIKNFREKATIKKFLSILNGTDENPKLSCYILPNPSESAKYQKSIKNMRNTILQLVMRQKYFQGYKTMNISEFVFCVKHAIQLLSSGKQLSNLYQKCEQIAIEQAKVELTLYKSLLGDSVKVTIKQELPMPKQLVLFKFKSIQRQWGAKNRMGYNKILEVLGEKKVEEAEEKIFSSIEKENHSKIKQLILRKIKDLLNGKDKKEWSPRDSSEVISFLTNYSFVTGQYLDFANFQIQRSIRLEIQEQLLRLVKEFSCRQKEQVQNKHLTQTALKQEIYNLAKALKQKDQTIESLTGQLQIANTEIEKMREQQLYKCEKLKQVRRQMGSHQDMIRKQASASQKCLREIQNQLKESLSFEKLAYSQQKKKKQLDAQSLLLSINKVLKVVEQTNRSVKEEEKKYFSKMSSLEKMNKSLRQRLDELINQGNSADIIQQKYFSAQQQHKQTEKQFQLQLSYKQEQIEALKQSLRSERQKIENLRVQLEIGRAKMSDKSRGFEFFERVLENKDKAIEQARKQVSQNLLKYREDLNNLKNSFKDKEIQLSNSISLFVVQNQQLICKNNELSGKLSSIEGRLRKENQVIVRQKQEIIKGLENSLQNFQKELESTTENYLQVTDKMERAIREKDQAIESLNARLNRVENMLKESQDRLEQYKQKYSEESCKVRKLEIEKEDFESRIKREQALISNKIKHMEQVNQKLKHEIKEKQNTFELMLLQLRSRNIICSQNSGQVYREGREKYLKRIQSVEEQGLKQLSEIKNKHQKPQLKQKVKPHIKSELQFETKPKESKENRWEAQYGTDKKRRHSVIETFSGHKQSRTSFKSPFESIQQTFKTVYKKI